MAFVAKKDFPANDFKELLAYVKSQQGQGDLRPRRRRLRVASVRPAVFRAIDAELNTVAYKGTGPAMNDLMGGQIDFMCDQTTQPCRTSRQESQSIRGCGQESSLRCPNAAGHSGLPGFEVSIFYGLHAPKERRSLYRQARSAVKAALKDPRSKPGLLTSPGPASPEKAQPEALRALLKSEIDKFGPIIKKAGVYAE